MKKVLLITLALLVCLTLALSLSSCNKDETDNDGTDTSAQSAESTTADTDAVTTTEADTSDAESTGEITTAETTAPVTTAEVTTDTEAVTTAEITTAEQTGDVTTADTAGNDDTTAEDTTPAADPVTTLVPVGTSYDGKTTSYDGRYDFSEEVIEFTTKYGTYTSLQDAIDDLEGEGGGVSVETNGDIGLCLNLVIPEDGCDYYVYYNYNNCDFTFNYGLTFDDDCVPHGYAYYASIDTLDAHGGLDGCHVYIWTSYEGLEPGYYQLHDDADAESIYNYRYERIGDTADYWPGLVDGETFFEYYR